MSAIFPDWVPLPLSKMHSEMVERNAKDADKTHPMYAGFRKQQALLERLLEPTMERAWAEVLKRIKTLGDPSAMIFFEATHALENTERPQETRAEIAAKYQTIAKAAREFGRLVYNSTFDTTPYRWFPDEVVSAFLGMMRPELALGTFCPTDPPPAVLKGTVYSSTPWQRLDGGADLMPFTFNEGLGGFFDALVKPQYPTMAEIVFAIAEEADRNAREALTEPRILPKPGTTNARRIIFVREFGSCLKSQCGGYLKRTLAAFATAALQEEVTADQVTDALRGFKPIPHRPYKYYPDRPRATYIHWNDPRVKK